MPGCKPKVPAEVALQQCLAPRGVDSAAIAACLTGQYDWKGDSAGRTAHRAADSIQIVMERARTDSIAAAQAASMLSVVNDAADSVKSARPKDDAALTMIWVGSRTTKLYYRGNCAAARQVKGTDRQEFTNDRMAESAGYKRSTLPQDEPCYKAPGL